MVTWLRAMNLKSRVSLVVIALVFLGIWGFAMRMSTILQEDLQKLVARQLAAEVNFVADELGEELKFRIALLKEMADSIPLNGGVDATEVQRVLDARNPPRTMFPLGVFVTNREGVIIADHSPTAARRNGVSLADRDFIHEVMAKDKPVIGRPVIGVFSGQPVIPIAVPLHDANGAVAGVLDAPLRNSDPDLFGKLRGARIGESGRFLVMSPKDRLIVAATEPGQIMKSLPLRGAYQLTDRRLHEGFEEAAVTITPRGIEVLGASRSIPGTGWVLIGNITTAEAFAPMRTFKNHIYVAALIVSFATAIVLYFLLRQQLSPLDKAGAAMQRMNTGIEPFGAIPIERHDEIGRLVQSFNDLVAGRQRNEEEIRQLNRTLEDRVKERTDQLFAANQRLEAEVAERKLAEQSARDYADRVQRMSRRTVEVQEEAQRRLARELHDQVGANLTGVCIALSTIESTLGEDGSNPGHRLSDCVNTLGDTIRIIRDISWNLHPSILDYEGFVPALLYMSGQFEKRTNITVKVQKPDHDITLPMDKEIALFRIAQEALINCAKHSHARTITICLTEDSELVRLSIKDDGVGFERKKVGIRGEAPGLGLLSMHERADAIGASCHIESAPGKGTEVIVVIDRDHAKTYKISD